MDYPITQARDQVIMIKVNSEERKVIKEKAEKHTRGNVSQWLRASAILFAPQEESADAQEGENAAL